MNVIETRGLAKAFGRTRVVNDVNLHVAQGDIYGFVGKNGAGKSTVMKMICGIMEPTAGEVVLFGGGAGAGRFADEPGSGASAATDARPQRPGGADPLSRVGSLIEAPGLLPNLTALQNLMALAYARGIADAKGRCREVLGLVGLDTAGKKKVKGFSLGMKQRLGLGLALLGSPDVLVLDEPLNGLDPEGTRAMRNLLVRLNQTLGVTILISSHVIDQLDRVATCYGVIANGAIVREVSAADVAAECSESLRVRTTRPERTLALLQERFPQAAFRAWPDGALSVAGEVDAADVSHALHDADQTVLELAAVKRDVEEYFVELMEGGAGAARRTGAPAPASEGGERHV